MREIILIFALAFTFNGMLASNDIKKNNSILVILPNNNTLENGEDTSGFNLSSVVDFHSTLNNENTTIDFATPKGGKIELDSNDLQEIYNYGAVASYFKSSNLLEKFKKTKSLNDVDPSNYQAVVCIGGLASIKDFSNNVQLQKIIKAVYENNGVVATLDNAVSALMNVKLSNGQFLIKGKKITTFTEAEMLAGFRLESRDSLLKLIPQIPEDIIKRNGGLLQEAEANRMFQSRVVEDQRVLTAGYQRTSSSQLASTIENVTSKPKKRILIVVTSNDQLLDGSPAGFYLPEVTDYHYVLSNGGDFEFDIASPKGGKAPMYAERRFLNDNAYRKYLLETGLLAQLYNTIPLSKINSSDYDAIHFAGGFASLTDFPSDENLKKVTRNIYEKNGIVSAVCHGPSALLNVKLSNGKYLLDGLKVTSRTVEEETSNGRSTKEQVLQNFPIILEDEIRSQKAIFTKGEPFEGYIESDKRVITGQGVPSTTPLAHEVLKQLS